MNPNLLHSSSIVVSLVATLTLFGCGGGGGGSATMMPDDDSTAMMPEKIVPTLTESLENPDNQFAPVTVAQRRKYSADPPGAELTNDIRVTALSGDGADGFHLTYVAGGDEKTVHFTAGDFDTSECGNCYYIETEDGTRIWFYSEKRGSEASRYKYFDLIDANIDPLEEPGDPTTVFMTYGIRTETADLPAGAAEYFGRMYSRSQRTDNPNRSGRRDFDGPVRVTADFDESTLNGEINNIRVRRYDQDGNRGGWEPLPDSNSFALENGQIADGQFTADLTGMDPGENALDDTVQGFEGSVLGEFYGPVADALGAVFNAESEAHARVLTGQIRGQQLNPRVPESDLSIVSADSIHRDFIGSTTSLTAGAVVTDIESDGSLGLYVTYEIDGVEQRVHFVGADYAGHFACSRCFFKAFDKTGYWLWDTTGSFFSNWEFNYFNVHTGSVTDFRDEELTMGDNGVTSFFVYGVPTEVSDLPAGSASYVGSVWTQGWSMNSSDRADSDNSRGSLELTADFGSGMVSGMFDDFEYRAPGQSSYVNADSPVLIQNGVITNTQFTADLVGQQDAAGFEGDMAGQFFGPGAAEVGGVLTGTNTTLNTVVHGWFGGTKQ